MNIQGETTGEVRLSGALSIKRVTELREALLAAIATHRHIILKLDDDADADISFVQLLLSARLSARNAGGDIRLGNPPSGALRDVVERGGFLAADQTGFWTKGSIAQ